MRETNNKIAKFLAEAQPETPCLVIDLDVVGQAYKLLRRYLPLARVFYAVKANPAPEIVGERGDIGCGVDVGSRAEADVFRERGDGADNCAVRNSL